MRKFSSLKYHAIHFMLTHLYLLSLISTILGSFDSFSEVKCEHEDANLIWRNTPTYSLNDVKAMAWYKGKGSLMATWLEGKGFVEYPPYIGRLMQIGETGIKIKTATRSDSGTYWLSLTLVTSDHKLEAKTHLDVKVAPSSECKPRITRSGSILKAELPFEGCGTPYLIPRWKHTNRTVNQENSSSLDLGSNTEPREYMACAEGQAATCYQGNISDLCTNYIIFRPGQSDDGHTSVDLPSILVPVPILILIALVIWFKRGLIRKSCPGGNGETVTEKENISSKEDNKSKDFEMSTIEVTLMKSSKEVQPKTKIGKVPLEIQNHLKKIYESLTNIPLSPIDDETTVCVSELYSKIDFDKVVFADVDNCKSSASSNIPRDQLPLISKDKAKQSNQFSPIFIFGDCGSGKSTWCKHLVKCWLDKSDNQDADIQGLNLPNVKHIQILLYLSLQFSDRGLSFQELLEKYLFKDKSRYIEFLMNYVDNNAQNVLIIMDGMDIIRENPQPIAELLHHKLVSSCPVIVTSRPASFKLLYDTCHDKIEHLTFFKIREMNIEDSKMYATRLLGSINCLQGGNLIFESFWDFTEHLQVQSLLKVPFICLLIMYVWINNKNNFIELTDILLDITNSFLSRALSNHQCKDIVEKAFSRKYIDVNKYITKLNKWPLLIQYSYLLHELSRVATKIFSSEIKRNNSELKLPKLLFITDEDRLDHEALCETGLLTKSISLSANKNVSDLSFSDTILCEFFVSIYIALYGEKECDFIVSSANASLQNSMIIHMLSQLSNTVIQGIIVKASTNFKTESKNAWSSDGKCYSNKRVTYSITRKNFMSLTKPVLWLQWLMYNKAHHENKLLFLTTALHCIDSLTSLVLEDHANNDRLVFWLPSISTLEILTLDITSCTLLLCKEWYEMTQTTLKEVVIKSVYINKGTLGLLIKTLGLCADLERLEISPAVPKTDNSDITPEKSDHADFTWIQLSERITENKKLKALKLSNLSLVGDVDIVVSRLNHYANLETLELNNLGNVVQRTSSILHSPGTNRVTDIDYEPLDKTSLNELALENLTLLHSPINFMFCKTKKNKTKTVQNNLKVLRMSAVVMPLESWKKLGNQIGLLKLSVVHLHNVSLRGSAQIFMDGIGKCEELEHLSLINVDTGVIAPYVSFLKNLKGLSTLHLELMKFTGSSSWPLFEGIRECKKLKKLSFCNIDIGEIPENVSFDLPVLSDLTVDKVRITEESDSLYWLLDAFILCKNLKTLSLKHVKKTDIPPELSNREALKINLE